MAVTEKTFIGTIDITPSWGQIMPVLVDLAHSNNMKARDTAYAELTRMAKLADLYVASQKGMSNG